MGLEFWSVYDHACCVCAGMSVPSAGCKRKGNSCPEIHQHPCALVSAKAETPSQPKAVLLVKGRTWATYVCDMSMRLEVKLPAAVRGWRGWAWETECGPCTRGSAGSSRISSTCCPQPSGDTGTYKVVCHLLWPPRLHHKQCTVRQPESHQGQAWEVPGLGIFSQLPLDCCRATDKNLHCLNVRQCPSVVALFCDLHGWYKSWRGKYLSPARNY